MSVLAAPTRSAAAPAITPMSLNKGAQGIAAIPLGDGPRGPVPTRLDPTAWALYGFVTISALFFLLPLYVMVMTSLKTTAEVGLANIFSPPHVWTLEPWVKAWSSACIGMECRGVSPGVWTSVAIVVPSTATSVLLGALTGYGLSFWRVRWADIFLGTLLLGAFLPGQVFIYPLVKLYATIGLSGSLGALIVTHVIFGLPVETILFRNFFAAFPQEVFKAARVDGAGLFQIFFWIILPMSLPVIVVGTILKVTWVWNDYLIGVVFGGVQNRPIQVQLMNLVATGDAHVEYNVNMAATILTALVPLAIYLLSGRWFVRGISAGAVKG